MQWLKTARLGGQVQRCHTIPTVQKHHSVAEHSFNCIVIANHICNELNRIYFMVDLSPTAVCSYLLIHDIPESYTGDIPANVKKDCTAIKENLYLLEEIWMKENIPEYASQYTTMTPLEKEVASLADSLEFVMFCTDDFEMGNRSPVFLEAYRRGCEYAESKSEIKELLLTSEIAKKITERARYLMLSIGWIHQGAEK